MLRAPFLFVLFLGAFALSACETAHKFSNDRPQLVAEPDNVSAMLADAATRASKSLETLAAIESARGPGVAANPIGDAPTELRRAITVNWVGPVEPILKTLADRANYSFTTAGNAPPTPVVVSLDIENRPVIDVLRDVGLQLGLRGDVRVDATQKLVEIHYAPNAGIGGF